MFNHVNVVNVVNVIVNILRYCDDDQREEWPRSIDHVIVVIV